MTILNDDGFLSPYSATSSPVISSDVADFLENSAQAFGIKDSLKLSVHSDCVDEDEKKIYPQAIKNYFSAQLKSLTAELKRNLVTAILFSLVGVCGLIFMIVYSHLGKNEIWVECIDIFAWVFLWEAIDQFFIQRTVLNRKRKRICALCEITVDFLPLNRE